MSQPQCKTAADLHRAWANVLDMCEGTKIRPTDCFKFLDMARTYKPDFTGSPKNYTFAIGIVEDKPVFVGDTIWQCNRKFIADGTLQEQMDECRDKTCFSWNPPKSKTIMVELLVEDAEYLSNRLHPLYSVAIACRKSLDELGKQK